MPTINILQSNKNANREYVITNETTYNDNTQIEYFSSYFLWYKTYIININEIGITKILGNLRNTDIIDIKPSKGQIHRPSTFPFIHDINIVIISDKLIVVSTSGEKINSGVINKNVNNNI